MRYEVREQQLASLPIAVVRRQAGASELSRIIPECCGLVWNVLRGQGIRGGRHVAVYWDDSVRLEVGVELAVPFIEEAGVVRSATPAGPAVSTTHLGPYGELGAARTDTNKLDTGRQSHGTKRRNAPPGPATEFPLAPAGQQAHRPAGLARPLVGLASRGQH